MPPRAGSGYVFWKLHLADADANDADAADDTDGCNGMKHEPWLAAERAQALHLLVQAQNLDDMGQTRSATSIVLHPPSPYVTEILPL